MRRVEHGMVVDIGGVARGDGAFPVGPRAVRDRLVRDNEEIEAGIDKAEANAHATKSAAKRRQQARVKAPAEHGQHDQVRGERDAQVDRVDAQNRVLPVSDRAQARDP
eukprot:CAMPEP_0179897442 /NCGR_PEP_ID=MMETSP0982-20121206/37017_1 /TAXON_ID=483367 /ORGANISM="non described non described, Strain CCMP 2436" /LENGTH=107 /DNA_ID=CAMNT_0021794491 /DNA_START=350 /DNA_END=673 /DNA_ORIENTATION=+